MLPLLPRAAELVLAAVVSPDEIPVFGIYHPVDVPASAGSKKKKKKERKWNKPGSERREGRRAERTKESLGP